MIRRSGFALYFIRLHVAVVVRVRAVDGVMGVQGVIAT